MEKDKNIDKELHLVQLKVGLTFKRLLDENEKLKTDNKAKTALVTSLGQLSSSTGLRKATLSDLVRGNSNPKASTIYMILAALGKSFTDFARHMDSIKDSEAWNYHKELEKAKKERKSKT